MFCRSVRYFNQILTLKKLMENSLQTSNFFPNGGHLAPQLHMMTSPGGYGGGHHLPTSSPEHHQNGGGATEANRKRAVRLQKNREAARECRRKKKEYIKCLENRVAVLEVSQSKSWARVNRKILKI